MKPVFSAYALIYLAFAMVPLTAVPYAWRRRATPGALWLVGSLVAASVWTLADGLAFAQFDTATRILFAKLSYLGAAPGAVFLFLFALEYTGIVRPVRRGAIAALLTIPVVSTIAAFTNGYHNAVWTSVAPSPQMPDMLVYSHGPLYWVLVTYGFVLLTYGSLALVLYVGKRHGFTHGQSLSLQVALLIPLVGQTVYSFAPGWFVWFDSAMAIGVSATVLSFSLLRFHLLDLLPVARDKLVEQMPEGVVVVDAVGQIVDINPAALALLRLDPGVVGGRLVDVLGEWRGLDEPIANASETPMHFTVVAPWGSQLAVKAWSLRGGSGAVVGRVASITDLSEQLDVERTVTEVRKSLDALSDEISHVESGFKRDTR